LSNRISGSTAANKMTTTTWLPLESNPDVMNKYLQKIGVPKKWNVVDVLGLDEESLSWVPKPVISVLLLFPCSEKYEVHKKKENAELTENAQIISENVFHMKQTVRNACGTVALLHSIANNTDKIQLFDGWLKQFLDDAKELDSAARGSLLENCEGVASTHLELAKEGQSNTPGENDPVYHHFIAFVHKDGKLYELDGGKSFPINHGDTTPETLLEDAAKVCRTFMERDPSDVNFTVVALSAADLSE